RLGLRRHHGQRQCRRRACASATGVLALLGGEFARLHEGAVASAVLLLDHQNTSPPTVRWASPLSPGSSGRNGLGSSGIGAPGSVGVTSGPGGTPSGPGTGAFGSPPGGGAMEASGRGAPVASDSSPSVAGMRWSWNWPSGASGAADAVIPDAAVATPGDSDTSVPSGVRSSFATASWCGRPTT